MLQAEVHSRTEPEILTGIDVVRADLRAQRRDLGGRRVVDDRDREAAHCLERGTQQTRRAVGDNDDLNVPDDESATLTCTADR